jgi:hypothetical protein
VRYKEDLSYFLFHSLCERDKVRTQAPLASYHPTVVSVLSSSLHISAPLLALTLEVFIGNPRKVDAASYILVQRCNRATVHCTIEMGYLEVIWNCPCHFCGQSASVRTADSICWRRVPVRFFCRTKNSSILLQHVKTSLAQQIPSDISIRSDNLVFLASIVVTRRSEIRGSS